MDDASRCLYAGDSHSRRSQSRIMVNGHERAARGETTPVRKRHTDACIICTSSLLLGGGLMHFGSVPAALVHGRRGARLLEFLPYVLSYADELESVAKEVLVPHHGFERNASQLR